MSRRKTKTVGALIREGREARHLTQRTLAEKIRRAQSTVSQWESDDRTPDLASMRAVAKALRIPVQSLIDAA